MAFGYWSSLDFGMEDDEQEDYPKETRRYSLMDHKGEKLANEMFSERFKTTFRMSVETFDAFEEMVFPLIESVGSSNGKSIKPREKMQIFFYLFVDPLYSTTTS